MRQITRNIIVKASPEEAFRTWSNFEDFPKFMKYVKSVKKTNEKKSQWEIEGPGGTTIEWEAEITRFEENKRIGWSTKGREEGDIKTSGQVSFNELPQGQTEVTLMIQFVPQSGVAGKIKEDVVDPEKMIEEDLSNFKAYIEGMYERTEMKK
jgi:uncharacterized membrane protein